MDRQFASGPVSQQQVGHLIPALQQLMGGGSGESLPGLSSQISGQVQGGPDQLMSLIEELTRAGVPPQLILQFLESEAPRDSANQAVVSQAPRPRPDAPWDNPRFPNAQRSPGGK